MNPAQMNPGKLSELPLRDIHLPDPVSWWPPAPGWWLLAVLIIALIILVPGLLRKLKQKPLKKTALNEFNQIQQAFVQHKNELLLVQQLSVLLRRVCISYLPREQSASTIGSHWIAQLNSLTEADYFSEQLGDILLTAPYQKQIHIDTQQLLASCNNWIAALPKNAQGAST
ncbi:MAG: DUF4381 domain-containing protein [Gammaproteobacteria bacterium]|nr:DUF4381 domain-containing protein [Gammaproteobacteria bacterium]